MSEPAPTSTGCGCGGHRGAEGRAPVLAVVQPLAPGQATAPGRVAVDPDGSVAREATGLSAVTSGRSGNDLGLRAVPAARSGSRRAGSQGCRCGGHGC